MGQSAGFTFGRVVLVVCIALGLGSRTGPLVAQVQAQSNLPPGFAEEALVTGLDGPTAFALAPDGRIYLTQKSGTVRVFDQGHLRPENFIDLSPEVNHAYDRGLLGIALHPDFARTHWVYLAYAYQPPEANRHKDTGARLARVIRVTADPHNLNQALPASMVVILGGHGTFAQIGNPDQLNHEPLTCQTASGAPVRDCLPVEGTAHQANMLQFGRDGALYVGVGDGGEHPAASLRAQDVNSLAGKILRINPLTGAGYPTNPFADSDLTSNRSKVFMLGLRNPFRFAFHPTSGELFIGDVGEAAWEEVNRGRRGANFGWPCFEGVTPAITTPPCAQRQAVPSAVVFPTYAYPHTEGRVAVIGGDFATGTRFPAMYRNAYFFGDYNTGTIWVMRLSSPRTDIQPFAQHFAGLVQITTGFDGQLYVLSIQAGTLYRLRWGPAGS